MTLHVPPWAVIVAAVPVLMVVLSAVNAALKHQSGGVETKWTRVIGAMLDTLSYLTRIDSPGTLKLPGRASLPPVLTAADVVQGMPPPVPAPVRDRQGGWIQAELLLVLMAVAGVVISISVLHGMAAVVMSGVALALSTVASVMRASRRMGIRHALLREVPYVAGVLIACGGAWGPAWVRLESLFVCAAVMIVGSRWVRRRIEGGGARLRQPSDRRVGQAGFVRPDALAIMAIGGAGVACLMWAFRSHATPLFVGALVFALVFYGFLWARDHQGENGRTVHVGIRLSGFLLVVAVGSLYGIGLLAACGPAGKRIQSAVTACLLDGVGHAVADPVLFDSARKAMLGTPDAWQGEVASLEARGVEVAICIIAAVIDALTSHMPDGTTDGGVPLAKSLPPDVLRAIDRGEHYLSAHGVAHPKALRVLRAGGMR